MRNASGDRSPLHATLLLRLELLKIMTYIMSVWRNWIARETSNLKVAGSSPVMDYFFLARIPERSKGLDSSSNA